ncbi:hypothetical protein [Pseudomonas sp. GXZC]|uniref:hypothetical protein n=1 Tax=Pseudomonas sp. GXZC TaxID=3003351 RepID=UPI0022AAF729|nr:hypothetical protein [Pseudomonas sp. GXZC]WAT30122.1 hypothetical protein OZ428_07235 [Pseudomonas sp. GXZC]
MNEAKHTPGPFFTTCPHGGTIYVEARLRGSTIQEVAAVGPTEAPEQQHENAKLFAAAPDLLKALEMCIEWMGDRRDISPESIEAWVKGRYAIAKATQ